MTLARRKGTRVGEEKCLGRLLRSVEVGIKDGQKESSSFGGCGVSAQKQPDFPNLQINSLVSKPGLQLFLYKSLGSVNGIFHSINAGILNNNQYQWCWWEEGDGNWNMVRRRKIKTIDHPKSKIQTSEILSYTWEAEFHQKVQGVKVSQFTVIIFQLALRSVSSNSRKWCSVIATESFSKEQGIQEGPRGLVRSSLLLLRILAGEGRGQEDDLVMHLAYAPKQRSFSLHLFLPSFIVLPILFSYFPQMYTSIFVYLMLMIKHANIMTGIYLMRYI